MQLGTRAWKYVGASLARQLVVGAVVVQVAALLLFAADFVSNQSQILVSTRQGRAEGIARMLSTMAAQPLRSADATGLSKLVASTRPFPTLRYAMVLSPNGHVLAHTESAKAGGQLIAPYLQSLTEWSPILHDVSGERSGIDAAAPIVVDGRTLGWAWVSLTRSDIQKATSTAIERSLLYLSLGALAAALFAAFVARNVTEGLRRLTRVAERFKEGDRAIRFAQVRFDEVGVLGRGVDAMLQVITDTEQSLLRTQRLAGIGSWRFFTSDKTAEWSEDTFRLFDFDLGAGAPTSSGFIHSLSSEGAELMVSALTLHSNRHAFSFVLPVLRPDGSSRFCWMEGVSEVDKSGKLQSIAGICQDVTSREIAERELRQAHDFARSELEHGRDVEEHLRQVNTLLETRVEDRTRERDRAAEISAAIFNSTHDAILTLSPRGGIDAANGSAQGLFGYTHADLLRQDVGRILSVPAAASSGSLLHRLNISEEALSAGFVTELTGRRADASEFPAELTLSRMDLEDETCFVAVVRDVSDRKRVERLKSEFVATVSHELRTPLTSIAGSLGLLSGGAAGEMPERASRLIDIAHSNSRRLVRLINDILDIEKMESGKLRFDMVPIDFSALAARSVESVKAYGDELGVEFKLNEDPGLIVNGDSDRLVQVVTNLLSNAAKFSNPAGVVEIATTRVGSLVRLMVRDHGSGIPEEFQARIFTKFAQADSSDTRQKGGTGLGLVIAKEIVERHGGMLWFESIAGEGAAFYVDIPSAEQPPEVGTVSSAGDRLLVCEDDIGIAAVIRAALEPAGYAVDVSGTLSATKAALYGDEAYRALLLDLQLPDGDGVDFLKWLRRDIRTRDLPVIVVSADIQRGLEIDRIYPLNVADWMAKPIDMNRLRSVIESVASRSGKARPVILHVDDDPDLLDVIATALSGEGLIVPARDLASARETLKLQAPDLVILDLGLPDGSGWELLPLLNTEAGPIPVVVFSALDGDEHQLRQVNCTLTKSRTSLKDLASTVRRLLDDRR